MSVMRRRMMMAPPRMGYIEGMAVHLDGIYNTPTGHQAATEWANLAGGAPLSVVGDAAWAGDGLDLASNLNYSNFAGQAYVVEQEPSVTGDAYTIEVVASWGELRNGVFISPLGDTSMYAMCIHNRDKFSGFGGVALLGTPAANMLATIAVAFSADNSKTYYINGAQAGQNVHETTFTGVPIVVGGAQSAYATYPPDAPYYPAFSGMIHGLRVYDRALSADEIAHNYAIDKERFGS